MFTDEETGINIHATLDCSVSKGTLRREDLLPVFMEIIKETPEYVQLKKIPYPFEDKEAEWWDGEALSVLDKLFDILDSYAPPGYLFGSLPDDDTDFGYWNMDDLDTRREQRELGIEKVLDSNYWSSL
jgi:hypothetical protein